MRYLLSFKKPKNPMFRSILQIICLNLKKKMQIKELEYKGYKYQLNQSSL